MKDFLMNCFYDGMTVSKACELINSSYGKYPTKKMIESVKKSIKEYNLTEWA